MEISHHNNLIHYINDAIAMERDIISAVRTQLEDDRVKSHPVIKPLFLDIAVHADHRAEILENLLQDEGGSVGGTIKETIAAFSGLFSGLHDIARQHPLSHMVRGNLVAMEMAKANYGMLLTLAVGLGHKGCETIAKFSMEDCPQFAKRLADLLPKVFLSELSEDGPLPNASATEDVKQLIAESCDHITG